MRRIFVAGEGFHVDEAEVRGIFVAGETMMRQKCGGFLWRERDSTWMRQKCGVFLWRERDSTWMIILSHSAAAHTRVSGLHCVIIV